MIEKIEKQNIMSEKFLTTKEVAEILNMTEQGVRYLIREKRLPAVRFGKRNYRIPHTLLTTYVNRYLAGKE